MEETLLLFSQKQASNNIQQSDWPKFLSDVNLFELQLTDATFREIIVTEIIIFVQNILSLHEDETKPSNKLTREQVYSLCTPFFVAQRVLCIGRRIAALAIEIG